MVVVDAVVTLIWVPSSATASDAATMLVRKLTPNAVPATMLPPPAVAAMAASTMLRSSRTREVRFFTASASFVEFKLMSVAVVIIPRVVLISATTFPVGVESVQLSAAQSVS